MLRKIRNTLLANRRKALFGAAIIDLLVLVSIFIIFFNSCRG